MLILTRIISNRLRYIADLMVRDMLGLEVMFTTSTDEYHSYPGPKLAYTAEPLSDTFNIEASGLLFENGIEQQGVKSIRFDEVPVLFQSANRAAALPFDPFASAFYMVSRYEEYLEFHSVDTNAGNKGIRELFPAYLRAGGFPVIHIADYNEDTVYKIVFDISSFSYN